MENFQSQNTLMIRSGMKRYVPVVPHFPWDALYLMQILLKIVRSGIRTKLPLLLNCVTQLRKYHRFHGIVGRSSSDGKVCFHSNFPKIYTAKAQAPGCSRPCTLLYLRELLDRLDREAYWGREAAVGGSGHYTVPSSRQPLSGAGEQVQSFQSRAEITCSKQVNKESLIHYKSK